MLDPSATAEFTSGRPGDLRSDPTSTEFDPYSVSIPFCYHHAHRAGTVAGSFVDNGYRGTYEFSHADEYRIHFSGGQYTEYIFAGPGMPDVLSAYTWLTGRMALPPGDRRSLPSRSGRHRHAQARQERTGGLGLGCMGMSGMYGPADRAESSATIHAALDAGIDLLDTGDFYGMGHNELLIAEAVRARPREDYLLSVKFGAQRGPDGAWLGYDASPPAVKTALAYTLNRLGVDHVDVYRPARLDSDVPIEETVGAIAELVQAGYVRHIGLSEVGAQTIRRAAATHPISDLQIEYSLISRGLEAEILPTCRELGIGITAYGVLSRGLISGHFSAERDLPATDFRAHAPRFAAENRARNLALVDALRDVAEAKGATVAQVAIAWVLGRGEDIVPLVGARTRERLQEALASLEAELDADDLAALERAVPPGAAAGDRYPEGQMAVLDSERG